jgi:hypothetical protein
VSQRSSALKNERASEVRAGAAKPAPRSDTPPTRIHISSKRHFLNFDGAFPLLLIGSALLCYAAVLANEELASKSTHLPLWGIVGAVGAVIAGAGIYSTLFVPPEAPALDLSKEWVTVPKADWEALRAGRATLSGSRAPPRVASPAAPPIPSRVAAPRPVWEEDWDVNSEGFRAAAAPPAPTDLVLRQIEEIDSAIRKKGIRPPPD